MPSWDMGYSPLVSLLEPGRHNIMTATAAKPPALTAEWRMSQFKSPALQGAITVRPVATRRVKPSGILHFTLSVTDLDRARKFYEEVVGATYWRQNDRSVFMRVGEQYFVLSRTGY